MFFVLSKLLWIAASPSNALTGCLCLGLALLYGRAWRAGRLLSIFTALALVFLGMGPIGPALMTVLENRFSRPSLAAPPTGVIVLGGDINETVTKARGSPSLIGGGSRMTEAVALARRYPHSKLAFAGGSSALADRSTTEAAAARIFFTRLGIAPSRLILEDKSRNTYENALFARALVKPKPGQVWLLVTSASHMARAVGAFRRVGFPVVPWPAGFKTTGRWSDIWRPDLHLERGWRLTDAAVHEWIGLAAYWASGRSSSFFPGPAEAQGESGSATGPRR